MQTIEKLSGTPDVIQKIDSDYSDDNSEDGDNIVGYKPSLG